MEIQESTKSICMEWLASTTLRPVPGFSLGNEHVYFDWLDRFLTEMEMLYGDDRS